MANLTKEQRAKREAENEAKLKAELEAKIKAELEEKIRAEFEEKLKNATPTVHVTEEKENVVTKMKTIQKSAKIPLDTVVPVVCNVYGGATYISKKATGYIVEWDSFGDIEYIELGELVSMRNTDRRFFEDNWIVLEDVDDYTSVELYNFLKVGKYYEKYYTPETIDSIFDLEPSTLIRTISELSSGMKSTIASRAITTSSRVASISFAISSIEGSR